MGILHMWRRVIKSAGKRNSRGFGRRKKLLKNGLGQRSVKFRARINVQAFVKTIMKLMVP
jgi:hypothetical protein